MNAEICNQIVREGKRSKFRKIRTVEEKTPKEKGKGKAT
jgi:hypothetical protein